MGESELRLDRYLANMGCGSRSEVKKLLRSGKVVVNGSVVRNGAETVCPGDDQILCGGEPVIFREFIYLMLNKPPGVISATDDSYQRTVLDIIDTKYHHKGLFPVGRLDKDTEGLLVLTNNGNLGHMLLAPKRHVPKTYLARVAGEVDIHDQHAFKDGITLDDGYHTMPAMLEILDAGLESEVRVTIQEGKFHQIKRMFQAREKQVIYLKRISMGDLILDPRLEPGQYREMTDAEIDILNGSVKN